MIKRIFIPFSGHADELGALRLGDFVGGKLQAHVEVLFTPHTIEGSPTPDREMFDHVRRDKGYPAALAYLESASEAKNPGRGSVERTAIACDRLTWREHPDTLLPSDPLFRQKAYLHDLTVASQHASPSVRNSLIDDVIFATGRPVLLFPKLDTDPQEIVAVVAWKPSAEAIHAVTAALPLLQAAEKCFVVNIEEPEGEPVSPTADVFVEYLAILGVNAEPHTLSANDKTPAEVLSSFYAARNANLLVMGAYSHARLRQLVFGGFTRHLLQARSHALLMAH